MLVQLHLAVCGAQASGSFLWPQIAESYNVDAWAEDDCRFGGYKITSVTSNERPLSAGSKAVNVASWVALLLAVSR